MSEKRLLIDGNSIAYPIFAASGGDCIIPGFVGNVLNRIDEFGIDFSYVNIYWDGETSRDFRKGIDQKYKANRNKKPESWYERCDELKKFLALLWHQIETVYYEADDEIYTACVNGTDFDNIIVTRDKDLLQCCHMATVARGNEIIDIANFKEKTEIESPDRWLYYLALLGDSSDNVKGVPGVGKVKAKKIINEWYDILLQYDRFNSDLFIGIPSNELKTFYKIRDNINEFKKAINLISLYITDAKCPIVPTINIDLASDKLSAMDSIDLAMRLENIATSCLF